MALPDGECICPGGITLYLITQQKLDYRPLDKFWTPVKGGKRALANALPFGSKAVNTIGVGLPRDLRSDMSRFRGNNNRKEVMPHELRS